MSRRINNRPDRWHNNHHKIAKKIWWTNDPDNVDRREVYRHRALHTLFWVMSTVEKVEWILEDDISVLQGDFVRDLQRILDLYKWNEYHSHCIQKPYMNNPKYKT